MALNDFAVDDAAFVAADMFQYLRENDATYDMIVLDPPAFAKHRRDVGRASRAYKDVNMKAMQRLNSGGLIFTCSCSQHISPDLFQKVLFAAATDANVSAKILLERGHSPDHPINIYHPEGRYLHAFLLQIEKYFLSFSFSRSHCKIISGQLLRGVRRFIVASEPNTKVGAGVFRLTS